MGELDELKERLLFQSRLDEFLEAAAQRRLSLRDALLEALPLLQGALGAALVWAETLDEELRPRVFAVDRTGAPAEVPAPLVARAGELVSGDGPRGASAALAEGLLLARRLDVAGQSFGTLAALADPEAATSPAEQAELLHVAAEVLDNYLVSIRQARQKQRLVRAIHEALRHPIVHHGVTEAVQQIDQSVCFDLLIVVYHLEEDHQESLHYLVFRGRQLEFDSQGQVARELDRVLRTHGTVVTPGGAPLLVSGAEVEHRRIVGEDLVDVASETQGEELVRTLGYQECIETVLISGVRAGAAVGKLVVGSRRPLTTYERDVFDLFADVLQKRIVDFSRTGKILQRTFPLPTVVRLLDEADPAERLTPRAAEISILYADIVSFTRLSEQILRDPVAVGDLIEAWSREVVRLLWREGGVFDKLVGDCVIGLFGPPYYERPPHERALACARAAAAIVRYTRDVLPTLPAAAPIVAAGEPLGVAIGINHCPASVGLFGPNRDFTAFSPGMNNTARLQSCAGRDEVLVLEPMRALIEQAAPTARFGPRQTDKVKNVAEPLVSYPLDIDSI